MRVRGGVGLGCLSLTLSLSLSLSLALLLPVSVVDVASIVPASSSSWSAAPLSVLIFFSMDLERRLG